LYFFFFREIQEEGDRALAQQMEKDDYLLLRDEHFAQMLQDKQEAEHRLQVMQQDMEKRLAQKQLEMANASMGFLKKKPSLTNTLS